MAYGYTIRNSSGQITATSANLVPGLFVANGVATVTTGTTSFVFANVFNSSPISMVRSANSNVTIVAGLDACLKVSRLSVSRIYDPVNGSGSFNLSGSPNPYTIYVIAT